MRPTIVFALCVLALFLCIPTTNADLTSSVSKLYGFTWGSTSTFCGQYGFIGKRQLRSSIICTNGKVTKLIIESKIDDAGNGACFKNESQAAIVANNNGWEVFGSTLKSITFYNSYLPNYFNDLYELSSLEEFVYDSITDSSKCTMNYDSDSDPFLPNAQTISIKGLQGSFPVFSANSYYVTVQQAPSVSLSTSFSSALANVFSPKLLSFDVTLTTAPSSPSVFNVATYFLGATKLLQFSLNIPGYNVNFASFFQPRTTLQTLNLYNVVPDVTTFPSTSQVAWGQLKSLVLQNMGLTGSVDPNLLDLSRFDVFIVKNNPLLTVTISNSFGTSSSITQLGVANTTIGAPLPANILSKGLVFLDTRGCKGLTNTLLPLVFLCMPPSYLVDDGANPSYLFNNDFSNYQGPNTPRNCLVQLNALAPDPFPSNISIFTLTGQNLAGDDFTVTMNNGFDAPMTLNCPVVDPASLICFNPAVLQGKGTLSLTVRIGANQTTVTRPFSFASPSITSVSAIPTLGGFITIRGYDLLAVSSYDNRKPMTITINGVECSNIVIRLAMNEFTCYYPAGIQSGVPISINVKGLYNDLSKSPNFNYYAPTVASSVAVQPNVASNLTITGQDFWNDTTVVTVTIGGNILCPVSSVDHTQLICAFPATPFSSGSKNIEVSVNGQSSQPNSLFGFVDTAICPESCNSQVCDVGVGFCNCENGSGPDCDTVLTPSTYVTSNATFPVLKIKSPLNNDTEFDAYLISVIENGAETFITSWNGTYANGTYTYVPSGGKDIRIEIHTNDQDSIAPIGGSIINYPANTHTYKVSYATSVPMKSLQFRFALDIFPLECNPPPSTHFAFPTGSNNQSLRWATFTKYDVEWFARFPMAVSINGDKDNGNLLTTQSVMDGLTTRLLVDVQTNALIESSRFQFDFSSIQSSTPYAPNITNCVPDSSFGNEPGSEPDNKWKVTVGVVVGVVGAAIVSVGSFFIIRQQLKLNKTKSLLDKKLRELTVNL
ncbi:IPT/TIG domain-containing protein [Cavenderia fasciculata]|uniref:IPT/TIG domain-containing protein n=1 Tax=Cavenderia fasciculata TaxID=261658 RepID=F4PP65_CACFS|nr:IPT/TIG domain-containing protein [Cavenderia fasciculata]EGG22178.1 IPT/TIG domain-containing protein [Cavenderia fasciculata]|eukprot:XP_004360029.1 IPT/TIG domain-containing protein [Cavenderia fasciculata]